MTTSFADTETDFDDDRSGWPVIPEDETPAPTEGTDPHGSAGQATHDSGEQPDSARHTGGKSARQDGRSDNRALIRRAAQKALEIAAATDDQCLILAGILGSTSDAAQLAVEVMTASRGALSVVSDLEEVATSDPMEAGILVASWPKPRVAALWSLLSDLGAVKGSRPANDAKAALALAKAAQSLSAERHDLVASVVALARKS